MPTSSPEGRNTRQATVENIFTNFFFFLHILAWKTCGFTELNWSPQNLWVTARHVLPRGPVFGRLTPGPPLLMINNEDSENLRHKQQPWSPTRMAAQPRTQSSRFMGTRLWAFQKVRANPQFNFYFIFMAWCLMHLKLLSPNHKYTEIPIFKYNGGAPSFPSCNQLFQLGFHFIHLSLTVNE